MSLQNREDSCVFCHAYLFEDDDVVYCPVCGAPHHRECYNKLGKCALEELHGTENQYDKAKQKAQQEPKAEPVVEEEPEFQFQSAFSGTGFAPFDFLGGVKPNEEIEEGVTAKDAAKFVFSNTMRYIPKFKALDKKHKKSWNFMAFFFPGYWMLSRKMYVGGIITCVLQIISSLLSIPYFNSLKALGVDLNSFSLSMASMNQLQDAMGKINIWIIAAAFFGALVYLALRIIVGIWGDWMYRKHVIKNVREINQNSTDRELDYHKKGGVNIFMFLIGMIAVENITQIIVWLFI